MIMVSQKVIDQLNICVYHRSAYMFNLFNHKVHKEGTKVTKFLLIFYLCVLCAGEILNDFIPVHLQTVDVCIGFWHSLW